MKVPQTTSKQLEILILLYRFRFLNRQHIQKLLHHKSHTLINSWLIDLTSKKIIGRIYSEKLKDNTVPAIYHLDTKAVPVLKDHPSIDQTVLKKAYRDRTRSVKLREHCLLVADIYLKFLDSTTQSNAKLEFYTRTQLTPLDYILKPASDAYIGTVGKETTNRYFLEIIDEHVPRFGIKYRIKQYFDYYDEQTWQDTTGKQFPSILIVCSDQQKLAFLCSIIQDQYEETGRAFNVFFTTISELKCESDITQVWKSI
jgi:hypothetical protein